MTISSAWLSSRAKISVLGTVVRPGKISVNSRSRKVSSTSWSCPLEITDRPTWLPPYVKSSSNSW